MNENKYKDYFKEEISFDNYSAYRDDVVLNNCVVNRTWGLIKNREMPI